jgi:hypothetical protein
MKTKPVLLLSLLSLASLVGVRDDGTPPSPGDPPRREETGRDRARRRRRAQAIAARTGLDVEECYRALGAGMGENEIVARRAAGERL